MPQDSVGPGRFDPEHEVEWDEAEEPAWPEWDSEDQLTEAVRAACQTNPPRLFALCEEFPLPEPIRVYAWGLDFGDGAVLTGHHGPAGSFSSAERARDVFGRGHTLHLFWLDSQPHTG